MPRKKTAPPPAPDLDLAVIPEGVTECVPGATAEPETVIPAPLHDQAADLTYAEVQRLRRVMAEYAHRQAEALRLYEPLPIIQKFHEDPRDERILRGSNRAGKTLAAAVECARAVTGQDPFGRWPRKDGAAALIGLDGRHCGEVFYKYLFRSCAFRMIRDLDTGCWRAYRPWTDAHRRAESRYAPPLIPNRYVREVSWEDKKRGIPNKILLTTGWELNFFSSKGDPPNGVQFDLWWIDEEIENEAWYTEIAARMLDRKGRGYWSATAQVGNPQLFDLHTRADDGDPNVGEHVALLEDNPHIDQTEKDKLWAKFASEHDRRVRIFGEFAQTGFLVYPEFHLDIHGYDLEGPLSADWSSVVLVDPGRQTCAVLFGALPPPPHDFVLLYDELYLKQCTAEVLGKAVAAKSEGRTHLAFLIDGHAGRVTEMGSGLNIEAQYAAAFKKYGLKSQRTGHGFLWGADDPKAGIEAVHRWLAIREGGTPYLRVARGRLPKLEWEIKRYHHKKVKGVATDEVEKRNDHLMDCLRYLALFAPRWSKPTRHKAAKSAAVRAMEAKQKKAGKGRSFVRLG